MVKNYTKKTKKAAEKKQAAKPKIQKTEKKKRAKKDPNAPKKALNGFMFFAKDKRESIVQENPEAKPTEITKLMGEAWRGMSDAEKQPYLDMRDKDKIRYEKEMAKYKPTA